MTRAHSIEDRVEAELSGKEVRPPARPPSSSLCSFSLSLYFRSPRLDIEPGAVQSAALVPRHRIQRRRHQDLALTWKSESPAAAAFKRRL